VAWAEVYLQTVAQKAPASEVVQRKLQLSLLLRV